MTKNRFKLSPMQKQRLYGLLVIGMCIAAMAVARSGETAMERDITAVLFFLPLGLYTLFTKKYVLSGEYEDANDNDAAGEGGKNCA